MIGMAVVQNEYPLYFDGMNEKGLCMAGLLFSKSAVYRQIEEGKDNVAPFEFIPWLLGRCASVKEAKKCCENLNLIDESFDEALPLTPLHWIIADENECFVVEQVQDGLHIYENPIGVLTNNPPFSYHLLHLSEYMHLSSKPLENTAFPEMQVQSFSRGMSAKGLPGDFSSTSRFVRAAFVKSNVSDENGRKAVAQFFHIMKTVQIPKGCVQLENGDKVLTTYTSCCDGKAGLYYYTTYDSFYTVSVDMNRENLDGNKVAFYPLETRDVHLQN
jgi:choloylglycine hydrolase